MHPKPGQTIQITAVRWEPKNIVIGDILRVSTVPFPLSQNEDGYVWVETDNPTSPSGKYGWVKWTPAELEESALKARVGKQRRELRRLNQSNRVLRLERDKAVSVLEEATALLLETRRRLRVAEAINAT